MVPAVRASWLDPLADPRAAWFLLGTSPAAQLVAGGVFAGLLIVECAAAVEMLGRAGRVDLQDVVTS